VAENFKAWSEDKDSKLITLKLASKIVSRSGDLIYDQFDVFAVDMNPAVSLGEQIQLFTPSMTNTS
jgi:hypothetical protein